MATSAISGKTGTVTNANGATEVNEFTVTPEVALLNVTSFDSSGEEEVIEGVTRCGFSFAGKGTAPTRGAAAGLVFGNSAGTLSISGDAIINSVPITNGVDGELNYSADGQFTGAVSITV